VNVHELNDDELDKLADFTAGVLAPVDHDRVARLIASDRRWAVAHAALARAEDSVRSDLRSIAGPIAMPGDVVARVDAALGSSDRSPADRSVSHIGGSDRVVRMPTQRSTPRRARHGREQSRWRRAGLAVVGVAAAAALVGGVGLVGEFVRSSNRTGADMSGAAAGPPARAEAPSLPGGPVTLNSGRNYQPNTLGQLAVTYTVAPPNAAVPSPVPAPAAGSNATSSNDSAGQAAPGSAAAKAAGDLSRLSNPEALRGCLAAIQVAHPGTPAVVDFAAFEGSPAIVVVIRQQAARAVVVVVGPACGTSGTDERYATTVG
jgi:hypothetical protein